MSAWAWLALAGGILGGLVAEELFRAQCARGLKALRSAAAEVLTTSDARLHAEVFDGPAVEGVRRLDRDEKAQAREDLASRVRHARFAVLKQWEEALAPYWKTRTVSQHTMMMNQAEKTTAQLLGRAYYSGFGLGQLFQEHGWWGPWADELALGEQHTKADFEACREKLVRFHPWLPALAGDFLDSRYGTAVEQLQDVFLEEDVQGPVREATAARLKASMVKALEEVLFKGILYGIQVQRPGPAQERLSSTENGHQ